MSNTREEWQRYSDIDIVDIDGRDYPDFSDSYVMDAKFDGKWMTPAELDTFQDVFCDEINELIHERL